MEGFELTWTSTLLGGNFGATYLNTNTGMTARQMRNFQHAMAAAEMSSFGRARVGCIVADGKRILSAGFNSTRSHPLQARYDSYRTFRAGHNVPHCLHAEIAALAPLIDDQSIAWNRVELYVARIYKDGSAALSRPCPACRRLIMDLGIRNLFYTSDIGYCHEKIA